ADVGRATKGAALALKARVLLYAASDLYSVNPSANAFTGYTTPQDRTALWRAAKNAAQAVMDLGIYSLYRPTPASPQEPAHAAAPYANRDPRFYGSILYDRAPWRQRPDDVKKLDSIGVIQTFRQLRIIDTTMVNGQPKVDTTMVPGLDTRDSPVEKWNGAYSGYYVRKFIDPSLNAQFIRQQVPWIFFRYAEILLNYAEASIELNELGDAVTALNQIRQRAGMPLFSAGLGQAALRDEYRNERRVEMVFEEQRFFDVRRWMIAPAVLSQPAGGINIFLDGKNRADPSTWKNYRYVRDTIQARAWDDKMYFMPIQINELNRNLLLKQNPGY